MSIFNIMGVLEEAWRSVILPGRQEYNLCDLGPAEFGVKNYRIFRTDFRLLNKRGHVIECSFYQHINKEEPMPCVVYLHANGCSRLEVLQYRDLVLSSGVSLFTFDFSGCGKSQGEYSSIGWHEQEDLECIIQYLYNSGRVSKVAVWGRSMGAITTILYAEKDPRISCIILDSPFSNFKKLVKELAKKKANIPGFLGNSAYNVLRKTIIKKAEFDVDVLKPMKYIDKIKIPALFGAAKDDSFVLPQHSKDLYNAYVGPKQLVIFEGDHNSERPFDWLLQVKEFLKNNLIAEKPEQSTQVPHTKSFKTYFPSHQPNLLKSIPSNPGDTLEKNEQKTPDKNHQQTLTRKMLLSPQDGLPNQKSMNFTWLEHSASTPVLPSLDEILKGEINKYREADKEFLRESNPVDSVLNQTKLTLGEKNLTDTILLEGRNENRRMSQTQSVINPSIQTYTIDLEAVNTITTQKPHKSVENKSLNSLHQPNLQAPSTSRNSLKENNSTSLNNIMEPVNVAEYHTAPTGQSSTSLNSIKSESTKDNETKIKIPNLSNYQASVIEKKVNDKTPNTTTSATAYDVSTPGSYNRQPIYTIDTNATKKGSITPNNIAAYNSTPVAINQIPVSKTPQSSVSSKDTFTSHVHSLAYTHRDQLNQTFTDSHNVNNYSSYGVESNRYPNKSFISGSEGIKLLKENRGPSPQSQKRKPLTFQINLTSNVPIIHPKQQIDLKIPQSVNFSKVEDRRSLDNPSNAVAYILKKHIGTGPILDMDINKNYTTKVNLH